MDTKNAQWYFRRHEKLQFAWIFELVGLIDHSRFPNDLAILLDQVCTLLVFNEQDAVSVDMDSGLRQTRTVGLGDAQTRLYGRFSNVVCERDLDEPDTRRILLQIVLVSFLCLFPR